ncbi:MAG TPA: UDP-N-acetylmuramoyl-L-alanine--D-glutamate ligase [Acidimicrobiales bacterium]|nr:UDP-N-acetylmuramoyl-L-alanine--D-glutamate ligase [Acidimicrobiales bacterium]
MADLAGASGRSEVALVVGFGTSGSAVARHLRDRGALVVAVDDAPTEDTRNQARDMAIEFFDCPDATLLASLVESADVVVPSPGVPMHHPVFRLAADSNTPVRGEVELAFRWTRHPIVAVTGTNGKTSVTALVTQMLEASGLRAVAAGNIGLPLSDAVRRDVDIVVAEVSSFQLWWTDTFRPLVAVWLNLAEDHLDWHPDLESYVAAKARIWAHQQKGDTAVVNADDPWVVEKSVGVRSTVVTFGASVDADYRLEGGMLRGPAGDIVAVHELKRALPHDISNALAASAAALAAGATMEGVRTALLEFETLPHRLSLVSDAGGVRWYDDSKATNPHAALAAARSFDSVVLVAGGRNKGLDLGVLAEAADRIRAVVAIGESRHEVEAVFSGRRPVRTAASMDEAVALAYGLAVPGDVVLLSPGCASFDSYGSYAERGDDFSRAVHELFRSRERSL